MAYIGNYFSCGYIAFIVKAIDCITIFVVEVNTKFFFSPAKPLYKACYLLILRLGRLYNKVDARRFRDYTDIASPHKLYHSIRIGIQGVNIKDIPMVYCSISTCCAYIFAGKVKTGAVLKDISRGIPVESLAVLFKDVLLNGVGEEGVTSVCIHFGNRSICCNTSIKKCFFLEKSCKLNKLCLREFISVGGAFHTVILVACCYIVRPFNKPSKESCKNLLAVVGIRGICTVYIRK